MKSNSIFLVGFMGAGKTTIGRILSKETGYQLVDIDELIVNDEQMPITKIFSSKGENHFRDLESVKLKELESKDNLVVSTGGGIILRDANINILNDNFSIYLKAEYETIFNRIKNDKSRPLLNTQAPYSTGLELFESRKAIYESFYLQVDTDNLLPKDVVKKILKIYRHAER